MSWHQRSEKNVSLTLTLSCVLNSIRSTQKCRVRCVICEMVVWGWLVQRDKRADIHQQWVWMRMDERKSQQVWQKSNVNVTPDYKMIAGISKWGHRYKERKSAPAKVHMPASSPAPPIRSQQQWQWLDAVLVLFIIGLSLRNNKTIA